MLFERRNAVEADELITNSNELIMKELQCNRNSVVGWETKK